MNYLPLENNDLYKKFLELELKIVNKHLPYRRMSLEQLSKMKTPHIILRDGTIHLIDREEINFLNKLIEDPEEKRSLLIPIVIEVNPSYGEGSYVIRDPIAIKVVAKILSIKNPSTPLILYRPQIFYLRRILRTTTTFVFIP